MRSVKSGQTLTEQVRTSLLDVILNGQLEPGSLHSVASLAEQLNVSRTPVREALIDLGKQGLVSFERNRGVRILERTVEDIEGIFVMRLMLEVPATRRAASRIHEAGLLALDKELDAMAKAATDNDVNRFMLHDRRFHAVIMETSGNNRITQYVGELRDLINARGQLTVGQSRELTDLISEHRQIRGALEGSDPARAAKTMFDHILITGELLLEQAANGNAALVSLRDWADQLSPIVAR